MKFSLFFIYFLFSFFFNLSAQPVWTDYHIDNVTDFKTLSAINNSSIWMSSSSAYIYRTSNNGENWYSFFGGFSDDGAIVSGINGTTSIYIVYSVYAGGHGVVIYNSKINKATCNGNSTTITNLYSYGGSYFIKFIKMTSSLNGYFLVQSLSNLIRYNTVDGGYSWTQDVTYLPNSGRQFNKYCLSEYENDLWFTNTSTTIFHSTNRGLNWTNQNVPGNCYAIWFNSLENGLAGNLNLYSTTNSGTNWVPTNAPGNSNITCLTGDGNNYWAAVGNSIYKTTNFGLNWTTEHSVGSVNSKYTQLEIIDSNKTIWATNSEGFISRYGIISNIDPINNLIVNDYQLNQNYPNPFNPETNINFAIPKSGNITLKVYNMEGKELAVIINENLQIGNYSVKFNGSNLPSGIYFYQLRSDDFISTKKMTLIK